MTRRVIWEGRAERLTLIERPCGACEIMHSTEYDSGAARSVVIPAEAVSSVAAALIGEGEFAGLLAMIERRER